MEHTKQSQVLFGIDIVNIIEKHVQELVKEQWKDDACPPKFWVSLNNEDMDNQCIMITIKHCGYKFTEKLFPRKNTEYGYEAIINQMISLYNQTI